MYPPPPTYYEPWLWKFVFLVRNDFFLMRSVVVMVEVDGRVLAGCVVIGIVTLAAFLLFHEKKIERN